MGYQSLEEALTLGTGIERSFCCPVHGDRNPSASVNSTNGLWICYTCGAKGKVDLGRLEIDPFQLKASIKLILNRMNPVRTTYPEAWLNLYDGGGAGQYWASRFDQRTIERYRLGMTMDEDYATYPLRNNMGEVLGVVRRSLRATGQKYLYPYGVDISKLIFDLHRKQDDVLILTEGATDAMAVYEAGFNNAVAMYGCRMSWAQRQQIIKYAPQCVLVAYDQDNAGHAGYARIQEFLGQHVPVHRIIWKEYKDLSEMPLELRTKIISSALDKVAKTRLGSETCGSLPRQKSSSTPMSKLRIVPSKPPIS